MRDASFRFSLPLFSIVTLIAVAVVTFVLGNFYRHNATQELIVAAERNNLAITHLLSNSVWSRYAPLVRKAARLSDDSLRAHPSNRYLMNTINDVTRGLPVVKVKIFDLQGRTLFSTELNEIGVVKGADYGGNVAANTGKVVSELSFRGEFHGISGTLQNHHLLSSYLPFKTAPNNTTEAVFEVYSDVTEIMVAIEQKQRLMMLVTAGVLAAFYAILIALGWGAQAAIRRRAHERDEAEKASGRMSQLLDNSSNEVLVFDAATLHCLQANRGACSNLGYTLEELTQLTLFDLQSDATLEEINKRLKPLRTYTRNEIKYDAKHVRKNGSRYPIELKLQLSGSEVPPVFLVIGQDITERKHAERELQRLASFPEQNPNPIVELSMQGEVTYMNANALQQFPEIASLGLQHPLLHDAMFRFAELEQNLTSSIISEINVGDQIFQQQITFVPETNSVRIYVVDVTEIRSMAREMIHQSSHDSLTGLVNRQEFEQRVGNLLNAADQTGTEHAFCYLDLDQFKVINDTSGHVAGDALLKQVASLLKKAVRRSDILARLGGDEFGVFLTSCPREKAVELVDAMRQTIGDFVFHWDQKIYNVSVSIGLVPVLAGDLPLAEIFSEADRACYIAKDQGRNRVHVYQQDDASLEKRKSDMLWVNRVRRALEENRFCLYFQPIAAINPGSEQTLHGEILLRMLDEEGQVVPPGLFLPAAERYQLMPMVDRWVLRNALLAVSQITSAGLPASSEWAINLSGQTVSDESFLGFAIDEINRSGVNPESLCFEITETEAIRDLSAAIHLISALRSLGCRFAVDDFGSGVSSFAYLKELKVDYLKIYGGFVREIANDPVSHAMVRSINEIGHVLGLRTIAEFVEDQAILRELKAMGVDFAQGYGIARPGPLDQLKIDHQPISVAN